MKTKKKAAKAKSARAATAKRAPARKAGAKSAAKKATAKSAPKKATARPAPKAATQAAPKKTAKPEKGARAAKTKAPQVPSSPQSGLGVGDRVPAFSLPDQHGKMISSDSLAGKPYVLYFYPKDDTPGCTREACGFRDDLGKFSAAGATVLGVSPDGEKSHARFADKYGLSFPLLSDTEKTLAKAFGVWVMKQNYGREYMGIERSTFVVGADGTVKKVFRRVKVDGHAPAVLAAL